MRRYIALRTVVRTGSFSKAADELGYTQSAMSQTIASLEQELGVRLLTRSRSGVRLTPDGEAVYPYIEQIIYRFETMQEKVREIKGLQTGQLRIGTLSSISVNWLPTIMQEFRKIHPGIDFIIQQGNYDDVESLVLSGAVDFGFVSPNPPEGIHKEELLRIQMRAILPAEHPLAPRNPVPLKELVNDPFILVDLGNYSEPLRTFEQNGLKPDIRYIIEDDYTIMSMVEAGMGVGILSPMVLQRANYNIAVRRTDPPVMRTVCIGYRDPELLTAAAKEMISFIKDRLEILP